MYSVSWQTAQPLKEANSSIQGIHISISVSPKPGFLSAFSLKKVAKERNPESLIGTLHHKVADSLKPLRLWAYRDFLLQKLTFLDLWFFFMIFLLLIQIYLLYVWILFEKDNILFLSSSKIGFANTTKFSISFSSGNSFICDSFKTCKYASFS